MKIAIMTQPLGKNYGGIMQAFALQKVLKELNHQPITINYQYKKPGFILDKTKLIYRLSRKIMGKRKAPINIDKHIDVLIEHNQEFINNNINQSSYIDSSKKLKKHFKKHKYKVVIVGSDQTWRPKYSPNIYDFYLNFIKKNKSIKRIAYATSFGVDSWEYSNKQTKKCAKLAKLFDATSVREKSGIQLCKNYLGIDSVTVLDPTLLLNKEDYLSLIKHKYIADKPSGVFTYFLDNNVEKKKVAELIATTLNTKTFKSQATASLSKLNSSVLADYKIPPLENWLVSFANAKFIVTDSFHGCVFSIIFNKPFIAIGNKERGLSRFQSLFLMLGLDDRLLVNLKDIDLILSLTKKDIDWNNIQSKLENHRNYSYSFLKNIS